MIKSYEDIRAFFLSGHTTQSNTLVFGFSLSKPTSTNEGYTIIDVYVDDVYYNKIAS